MTSSKPALVLGALRKSFDRGRPAVDGLDLVVAAGTFYALLGPNGAGKTTTLRMVAGLLRPDGGTVRIHGLDALADPMAAKRITAWLPDDPLLYDKLTPLEYLAFVAGLWSVPPGVARARAEDLLVRLDLWDQRSERCERFSRGMKQKVALAGALIHDPRLLILDEPLTGLDAGAARTVKMILGEKVAGGATVILTTHILEVAERLASRIGIIRRGRLLAEGSMAELRIKAGGGGEIADGSLEGVFLHLTRDAEAA